MEANDNEPENAHKVSVCMVQVFQTPVLILAAVVASRLESAGIRARLGRSGEQYTIEVPAERHAEAGEVIEPDPGGLERAA